MKRFLLTFALLFLGTTGHAEVVRVAVAANFTAPMRRIAADFERESGHKTLLAFGSTGMFNAQIRNGAPFDVLLAADDETPAKLERDGQAVVGSRFTYAAGRLVLWSAQAGYVDQRGDVLKHGMSKNAGFRHIALASPKLAPYGAAAIETMHSLGILEALRPRFVEAENVAQAWQFVASGNAELGFVAASQVMQHGRTITGSAWLVPASLHRPIRQDAVLLDRGKGNAAASALLRYLGTEKAKAIIRAFGYDD